MAENGPTPLWTALEAAHDTFRGLNCPSRGTYRVAVTSQGQYVWHPGLPDQRWPLNL